MSNKSILRLLASTALACVMAAAHSGEIADFESGLPAGWTTAGSAWSVVTTAGDGPVLTAPHGARFATSGAPNTASERFTGKLTSSALTVVYDTLQWQAVGWSGNLGNGLNRFEILNASFAVVATVAAPLSDSWKSQGVNLLTSGLSAGDTFYFRAVDGNDAGGYAWLALDDLKFAGNAVAASVPEPSSGLLMLLGVPLLMRLRMPRWR